jgi:hypothetical protein
VCDVLSGSNNQCFATCTIGGGSGTPCATGTTCAPVFDSTRAYAGANDCYPDNGGTAVGMACDLTMGGCTFDAACVPGAGGGTCDPFCIIGGAATCRSGQSCIDLGFGMNLGACVATCPTVGATTGCPSGQICDALTQSDNVCFSDCTLGGTACTGAGEFCSPVFDGAGAYANQFDCFPDNGGVAPGQPCTQGTDTCRFDSTCQMVWAATICTPFCLRGGAATCPSGQTCVDAGAGGNLGFCQ